MDQLDLAVAMQAAAQRQASTIRDAERRRMRRLLDERSTRSPIVIVEGVATARTSARAWLAGHLHILRRRPATP